MRNRNRMAVIGAMFATVVVSLGVANGPSSFPAAASVAAVGGTPIQHVVVIYQENHTFDETLGALCRVRTTPCDGFTGTVTLKGGIQVPMRRSPDVVPQVVHLVAAQAKAIDGGAMDGWAGVKGCDATHNYACLTYYTPGQIPNLARLANVYAVSDRTFSMAASPSWGGHLYAAAASLDGFTGDNPIAAVGITAGPGWGCDSKMVTSWRSQTGQYSQQPSCIPDPRLDSVTHPYGGAFQATQVGSVKTIFDRLDTAGLAWKIYGQPPSATAKTGYVWSICPSFAECIYTKQASNLVPTANVLNDAATGALPAYSVLTPSDSSKQANGGVDTSQHNYKSMLAGDNWIGRVVSAIQNGPDAATTAIFITYDDCGCFYDHVRPPVNPDGTSQGPRMPMVIVSPYVKAGYTDSTPASLASILAFTEHTFALTPLSANDANAYDYSNSFDYTQKPAAPPKLTQRTLPAPTVTYLRTHPGNDDDVT